MDITESEILEALRQAFSAVGEDAKNAYTTRELCLATGKGRESVCRAIGTLIDNGAVEATRVQRKRIDGTLIRVPAYRFTEEE